MNTKKSKLSQYVKKYIYIFIGSIITAIGLEIFLIPNNIIDGGVVGISIMLSAITGLPFGAFLILINLPFLYLGYKHIGKAFAIATTFAVISLSFWSSVFLPVLPVTNDYFLAAVFGGIITGTGVGLIIRNGGSLDGTEIVAILTDKKTVFSVGEIVMFINLFILSSASLVFGWDKAMYSLVAYFVIAKMIDVVLKGLEETYSVMIVTSQHTDILKSARMRQDFTANVSHELKTPLTSISGYSELIESGMAADEDIVRFAAEIHKNSNRLLTLINDIIRLSELDQVEEQNCFEELDIYDIAQNCVEMLRLSAKKHDVTMELHGVHRIICANRQMMDELVYNLCDNAIRYNNPGGRVDITVDAAVAFDKTAETGATIIEVKDTGIGISKEHQERIFERFYRVDKSRSKSTGGTGLGLAIVKHIVAAHKNASLSLTSEPGKGTCIRVDFKMKTNLE